MQREERLELRVGRDNSWKQKKKVFSCNFCGRKFCSSQALGGHQNAHRRERSLLGQSHNIMPRSLCLWVRPQYSHLHKPPSTFTEGGSREMQLFTLQEGPGLVWPGKALSEHSDMLDLNLKL